jgi:hypothetical protein
MKENKWESNVGIVGWNNNTHFHRPSPIEKSRTPSFLDSFSTIPCALRRATCIYNMIRKRTPRIRSTVLSALQVVCKVWNADLANINILTYNAPRTGRLWVAHVHDGEMQGQEGRYWQAPRDPLPSSQAWGLSGPAIVWVWDNKYYIY